MIGLHRLMIAGSAALALGVLAVPTFANPPGGRSPGPRNPPPARVQPPAPRVYRPPVARVRVAPRVPERYYGVYYRMDADSPWVLYGGYRNPADAKKAVGAFQYHYGYEAFTR